MDEWACAICGKYQNHRKLPDQWLTTKDGKFMWFHQECYERKCKRAKRCRGEMARPISRARNIHGGWYDQLKIG